MSSMVSKITLTVIVFLSCLSAKAQSVHEQAYQDALEEINAMLEGRSDYRFADAVFAVENAWYADSLSFAQWHSQIQELVGVAHELSQYSQLLYEGADSLMVRDHAAIFTLMAGMDTMLLANGSLFYPKPYTYDFDDFTGSRDWTKMFVSKLLKEGSGNCHSLPYLYKIVAEAMGRKAWLAQAPGHLYIKLYAQDMGWYNVELTSGTFPVDAWIMASGYVSLEAIQTGVYMDTLSNKESLALCLIDLGQGYQRQFGKNDTAFSGQCIDLALRHFPDCINALLFKAEMLAEDLKNEQLKAGVDHLSELFFIPEIAQRYEEMNQLYAKLYQLGYRQMPDAMYLSWLKQVEAYQNKGYE